ncbi:MAG TPA: hypothetical protein VMY37_10480 [Thermoguttaceae bacterium]|nr:hypothetical protein [Thermoguttaceae bacterium]
MMRSFGQLAPLAVIAALLAAMPAPAEENESAVVGEELVSWQAKGDPWSGYDAGYDDATGRDGATGCEGAIVCGDPLACRRPGLIAGMELPLLKAHYGAGGVTIPGEQVSLSEYMPDFGHEATPRFWLGYETCDGLAFRVRYWQFDHTASAVDARASYYVEVGVAAEDLDFELAQSAQLGNWEFEVAGGARWAKVSDDVFINWDGDLADWTRSFEGGGPTFGVAARRPLCIGGLGLVADFRASFIYGDANFALADDVLEIVEDMQATIDDQVIEIYEIRVGAEWSRMTCAGWQLTGRLMLEGQVWELAPGPLGLFDTNLGFVGPTFSLAIER